MNDNKEIGGTCVAGTYYSNTLINQEEKGQHTSKNTLEEINTIIKHYEDTLEELKKERNGKA